MLLAPVPQLTFVDFLEALTRLAIAIPIPSDEDMREVKVMHHAQSSWLQEENVLGSFVEA